MRRRIRRSFVEQAAVLRSLRERLDRRLIERELASLAAEITDHDIMKTSSDTASEAESVSERTGCRIAVTRSIAILTEGSRGAAHFSGAGERGNGEPRRVAAFWP